MQAFAQCGEKKMSIQILRLNSLLFPHHLKASHPSPLKRVGGLFFFDSASLFIAPLSSVE